MPTKPEDNTDNRLNGIIVDALMPAEELRTAYDQLRPFERQFVDAYLASESPTKAMKAIFPGDGIDPKKLSATVRARTFELMHRPLVQAAIAERLKKIADKWELTADRVTAEIAKIAYSNMDDYFKVDPITGKRSLDLDSATRDQMASVGKIKVTTRTDKDGVVTQDVEFALHDKLGALEKAMKNLGLYAPVEVNMRAQIERGETGDGSTLMITVNDTDEEAAAKYAEYLENGGV